MRRTLERRMVRLLAVALLITCSRPAPMDAAEGDPEAPLVLALYYGWYDWPSWSQPYCDQPVRLYVSVDTAAVERHVCEARDAGLDALVQVWYGPTLVDNPTAPNLDLLLDKAAQHGVRVAVLLDMTGPFLRKPDDVAAALAAVRDQVAYQPAYLAVETRPVVFFLGQQLFPIPVWESLRSSVDSSRSMIWIAEGPSTESLEVFDGLYLHQPNVRDPAGSLLSASGDAVRAWSRVYQTPRLWVATVLPGYDDSLTVGTGSAWVRPRAGGATYRESWATAVATLPDWILVRSFNEWPACTQIESSVRDGDSYLALTAELAAQTRADAIATPVPTDTAEPPAPTPTEVSQPLTVTVPLTVTPEITVTATLTPTETPLPTLTPFRLATPTPVVVVAEPGASEPVGVAETTPYATGSAAVQRTPALSPTGVPRMPVEGGAPSRCLGLPFLLVMATCGGTWLKKRL